MALERLWGAARTIRASWERERRHHKEITDLELMSLTFEAYHDAHRYFDNEALAKKGESGRRNAADRRMIFFERILSQRLPRYAAALAATDHGRPGRRPDPSTQLNSSCHALNVMTVNERKRLVWDALAQVEHHERDLIIAKYWVELSERQLCQQFGLGRRGLKLELNRLLHKLRVIIDLILADEPWCQPIRAAA
jgi:DNA-directed RNA polymerase specialized sigma24 family protein